MGISSDYILFLIARWNSHIIIFGWCEYFLMAISFDNNVFFKGQAEPSIKYGEHLFWFLKQAVVLKELYGEEEDSQDR